MHIKIGTRASALALKQTDIVVSKIKSCFPYITIEIVKILTSGDKITDRNLYDIGGKALFLKEIEDAMLNEEIDVAVHSMKDIPGKLDPRFEIAAVLEREDPRDAFVSSKYSSIETLPKGAVVGSSSMRRKVILQNIRPDLQIVTFRGNVLTRLKKIESLEVDATILAVAGLKRLGLESKISSIIDPDIMLPAPGQGLIAIEVLSSNHQMRQILSAINNRTSYYESLAERSFMEYLDASCDTPLAAYAIKTGDTINIKYMLSSIDGKEMRYYSTSCDYNEAKIIGYKAGKIIKSLF